MIIIGAKGFAKEVLEILYQQNYEEEIVFFDNVSDDLPTFLYEKFRILKSFEELTEEIAKGNNLFTLGLGSPAHRYKLYKKLIELDGLFSSTISPKATIGHFDNFIGEGVNIMSGVVVTNSIRIETGVLINLNVTVGHDSKIGAFSELSPGAHISGNCNIGSFCNIGTNATVLPNVTIGENCVIGAGAVINKSVPANSVIVGVPGKIINTREPLSLEN